MASILEANGPVLNGSPLQFIAPFPTCGLHLSPVSCTEVSEILGSMKYSAPGYDNLSAELLKVGSDIIVKPLTHIFNLSFSSGIVSQDLKMASISKILKKLVYYRLLNYLHKNLILYKHQYGFGKSCSTYYYCSVW